MAGAPPSVTDQQDHVVIRPARHADLPAIHAIGDVYGGRDFLYAMGGVFLDDTNVRAMVAVVDGSPVGFSLLHIVDGGKSVNRRCSRVHKDFRNKGIYHLLTSKLMTYIDEADSPIERYTMGTTNFVDRAIEDYKKEGIFQVLRKRIINMCYTGPEMVIPTYLAGGCDVLPMTPQDLERFFQKTELVDTFLPNRMFFNRYMGYKAEKSNIQYLLNEFSNVYATTNTKTESTNTFDSSSNYVDGHRVSKEVQERNFSDQMLDGINMISCTEVFPSQVGMVFACNTYSAGDTTCLTSHIAYHMKEMKKVTPEKGVLTLTYTDDVTDDDVLPLLKQFCVHELLPGTESHKVWWEKQLEPRRNY